MKNLKKVLALALAFAMAFSMFANAAFTDAAAISADHADDVAMLVELGVLGGYPDGSFKPENTITRAEFTKMAYTIKYGYDDAGKLFAGSVSKFTDVEGVSAIAWAKGYINYCANQGIIGGVGNNKFNPNGNVTVAEAAKMLLVILGCDAAKEGYGGSNWMGNVVADAMELGVFEGWVGDPTAPATRELVATLMANTIFAPTYVYNPITGVGSQINPLSENAAKNETLGEKTMGLKHKEGIIVANDTLYINKDGKGEAFDGLTLTKPASKDSFELAYEVTVNNKTEFKTVEFEVDMPNEYIGAKATVYWTVKDGKTTLLGDVVLSADTVIYDLTSADIKIMPDGKGHGSSAQMLPYISINAGDKEYQIKPRGADRSTVRGDKKYEGTALLDYFFFPTTGLEAGQEASGELVNPADATAKFYADLEKDSIQAYRAISVDGGKTISYIVRTSTKELAKVNNYSVANDTIRVGSNYTTSDLEENLVLEGEIAKGDQVVVWKEAGKLYVAATEEVVGKATVIDDNEVTIGDKNYKSDLIIFNGKHSSYADDRGIAYYYANLSGSNTDTTTYVAYNGYILDIENTGATVDVDQYAVVLQSDYDYDYGAPKVRLAFTDESAATYYVNRIDSAKINKDTADVNFKPAGWEDDKLVGRIFRYSLASDGTVNLFTDSTNIVVKGNATAAAQSSMGVIDGEFVFDYNVNEDTATKPLTDENTLVFMLYGGGDSNASASDPGSFDRVQAAVYKLIDLETTIPVKELNTLSDGAKITTSQRSYVKTADKVAPVAILAAIPVGTKRPSKPTPDNAPLGILLDDMKYIQDPDTNEYYANVKMITEDGLVNTKTVLSIHESINDTPKYGKILNVTPDFDGDVAGELGYGSLISYTFDDEGAVASITLQATPSHLKNNVGAEGYPWTYATISDVSAAKISYYNWSAEEIDTSAENVSPMSKKIAKYGVKVWAIDGEEVVANGEIEAIERGATIDPEAYNAIVRVESGNIERVISFYGNI